MSDDPELLAIVSDGDVFDGQVSPIYANGYEAGEQAGFERGVQAGRDQIEHLVVEAHKAGVQAERERWENDDLVIVTELPDLKAQWSAAGRAEGDAEVAAHLRAEIEKLPAKATAIDLAVEDFAVALLAWLEQP